MIGRPWLAAVVLFALVTPALATDAAGGGPSTAPAQSLGRSMAKLKDEKALRVGYFGGSITAGAGASKSEQTSWRALTTAWFRQQFPEAKITEINAAIGGTGSDLGAFRCQSDLLDKSPDLVFVEFAVNDGGGAERRVTRAMEASSARSGPPTRRPTSSSSTRPPSPSPRPTTRAKSPRPSGCTG